MVKADLIEALAEAFPELSKNKSKEIIDMIFDKIQDSLVAGDDVLVTNFGKFSVKMLAARQQKIPGSGKIVNVPQRRVARFKPGKALKEAVK